MVPKLMFFVLSLLNGGWMLFDGVYVLKYGKYFGPPDPGPWSKLFSQIGIDPFSLGPVFIVAGVVWLFSVFAIFQGFSWGWALAIVIAVSTIWYIPIGTVISILVILLLVFARSTFVGA